MLAICRNNANRLQSFLDDILHFQELYEERISLNVVPIQVNRLLNEVFVSLKKEADLKKLKFTIELDQDTPFIEGDAEKLQYVFYTIISNAIRYTRKGSIQVLSSYDPNKELVILQVTDTGIGIKTEDLTHLFTAFSQIPSEENYHIPESKGLSLASAKKIVELHGGSIQVKSEYKKGSEFCIQLPLKYEKYYSKIKN
jgi:signal transduction histidine kinase